MKRLHAIEVPLTDFKARLSAYVRTVRAGQSLTVMDRRTPAIRVSPVEDSGGGLVIRAAHGRPQDVPLPAPPRRRTNSLAILMEERRRR